MLDVNFRMTSIKKVMIGKSKQQNYKNAKKHNIENHIRNFTK